MSGGRGESVLLNRRPVKLPWPLYWCHQTFMTPFRTHINFDDPCSLLICPIYSELDKIPNEPSLKWITVYHYFVCQKKILRKQCIIFEHSNYAISFSNIKPKEDLRSPVKSSIKFIIDVNVFSKKRYTKPANGKIFSNCTRINSYYSKLFLHCWLT